jgi:carboxylesterase
MTGDDRGTFVQGGRTGFLLLHGLSGTPVELRYIANGLVRAGHTVSCPQLSGHCGSLEDLTNSRWQDWYQTAEVALEQLREHCDHIIVGGLSMGAVLALRIAAENRRTVDGIALYAPTLWLDGWAVPWYAGFFSTVFQKSVANRIQFSERAPYGIKDTRLRTIIAEALHSGDPSKAGFFSIPGGPMLELRWLVNDVRRRLAGIMQPTLVIHPRDDDRASLRNVTYLEKHLGARVHTVVLDDSYHIITLDRQRDLVLDRTISFANMLIGELGSSQVIQAKAVA